MTLWGRFRLAVSHRSVGSSMQDQQREESMQRLSEKARQDVKFASANHDLTFKKAAEAIKRQAESSSAAREVARQLLESLDPHWTGKE